ncbi:MAG: Flp pilus assembly protein CpaB [Anaerolineales bacterium]
MRGNRTLIIIAGVLILLVLVFFGAYYFVLAPGDGEEPAAEEVLPTPTPSNMVKIVVAVQNINLGTRITTEGDAPAVRLRNWPDSSLPLEYFESLDEVEGKIARLDIPRGMPLMSDMLADRGDTLSMPAGSNSLFQPNDRVAYAIPMDRQGGVAWGIRPGDHVDVVAALKMIPVSGKQEGLQQFTYLSESEEPDQTGVFGSFETLPNGRIAAIAPANTAVSQVPNLLVQLTVQDAVVWKIGTWEKLEEEDTSAPRAAPGIEVDADPEAEDEAEGEAEGGGFMGGGAEAEVVATPIPEVDTYGNIEPVTLLVTREDVLVLKYLLEMGADLDLVLRPAGFTDRVMQTQPVWLRYVIDRYQLPDTMPDLPVAPKEVRQPLELPLQTPPTPEEGIE